MTKDEFYAEYLRLHQRFPHEFMKDNPSKLSSIYEAMKELDRKWFSKLVARILLSNNTGLNILSAAQAEIRSQKSHLNTSRLIETMSHHGSQESLDSYLSEVKAVSLWDAVEKSIGKRHEP